MPEAPMKQFAREQPLFSISVTAELSGVNPQMLRVYEERGLLSPFRTGGGTRRYSHADLERVSEITALIGDGLNLAGVQQVLALRRENRELRAKLTRRDKASG